MLEASNFKEGKELSMTVKVEISLPNDDAMAMIVLLDVIHDRNKRVPHKVSLNLLTRISLLVHRYQIAEACDIVSNIWINNLQDNMPEVYDSSVQDSHYLLAIA